MDPNRDTPLKRFSAFWIGLFLVLSFGLAAFLLAPFFTSQPEDPILEERYKERLLIKAEIDEAQESQLQFVRSGDTAQVPPEIAFSYTARQLLGEKARVVKKPEQVVPGSPTAEKLATQLTPATPAPDESNTEPEADEKPTEDQQVVESPTSETPPAPQTHSKPQSIAAPQSPSTDETPN